MSRVIAAVTGDSAAEVVLSTATAVGRLFGAQVEALHVGAERVALSTAARKAGVNINYASGEAVATLAAAASIEDVTAVVVGARGAHSGKRPAGSTAIGLITLQPLRLGLIRLEPLRLGPLRPGRRHAVRAAPRSMRTASRWLGIRAGIRTPCTRPFQ